uniref:Inward rectifier potassium channel C-terminal domain-containing protein n=1 Tax=Plectus sambesii TaxID=2011161 RepID=A0A914WWI5_9BILA
MKVGSSRSDDDRIFLVWPITLCHVIDAESPLYEYASKELPSAQFEIIVLLEGIVESTGMTAQARTSYLPSEIVWGHRFKKLVTYQRNNGSYQIDYNLFHCTYPVTTPQCSAKEFYKMKRAGLKCGQSDHYFCKSESEQKLEDGGRSLDCSPSATPSPLPSSPPSPSPMMITNKCSFNSLGSQDSNHRRDSRTYPSSGQDTLSPSIPPIIVVQSPSSSNSPINTLDDAYSPLLPLVLNTDCHSYDLSTRPSTALSDLEEESSDLGSPH